MAERRDVARLSNASRQTNLTGWLSLLLVCIIILAPRLPGLDRFVTPDEPLWLTRSANFYSALAHGDLGATFQREHPGVPTMWLGAAGYTLRYPDYPAEGPREADYLPLDEFLNRADLPATPLEILQAGRIAVVLAHTLILGLAFVYARRSLGLPAALLGFGLIAFNPFHLANSRLLHLDALQTDLMLLSLLAFLRYQQVRGKTALLVSGIAAGLSWLTKSPALFLIPVVGLIGMYGLFTDLRREPAGSFWECVRRRMAPLLAWGLTGMATFFVFWPAMWVQPLQSLQGVFSMAEEYMAVGHGRPVFFGNRIFSDGQIPFTNWRFYPLSYLWRTTPVSLLGLLLAPLLFLGKAQDRQAQRLRGALACLLLSAALYTLVMQVGSKKFDRYLLPVFPLLDLVAAAGWLGGLSWLAGRMASFRRWVIPIGIGLVALQAAFSLPTYPYYLSYYNPLLGGSRDAPYVMQIGWGEGLDQAGRYLSQKPDAAELKVSAWYDLGSFSYFFPGQSQFIYIDDKTTDEQWRTQLSADYAVIYIHQWQRDTPRRLLRYLADQAPEHSIWLNGLEYVRIYRLPGETP